MNRGHHIRMAQLKAENEKLRTEPMYQVVVHPPDEIGVLKRRIKELEAENARLNSENQRLIKLANLY